MIEFAMDITLVISLLWLAWLLLAAQDMFKAIILFIIFGLFMALVWARLNAPDVALAEAAIGSGLSGALLLASLRRSGESGAGNEQRAGGLEPGSGITPGSATLNITHRLLTVLIIGLAGTLVWAAWVMPPQHSGLTEQVTARMQRSGVSNPVTAVLLNFRGYDTLLEIGVLLLALICVRSLGALPQFLTLRPPGMVLMAFTRLLVPFMVLVAGYLLWAGAHAPGGAFQGGAVLAAAGVLLLLADIGLLQSCPERLLRALAALGFTVFLLVASMMLQASGQILNYTPARAGAWILLIESAALISIALILVLLFSGGRFEKGRVPAQERDPVQ